MLTSFRLPAIEIFIHLQHRLCIVHDSQRLAKKLKVDGKCELTKNIKAALYHYRVAPKNSENTNYVVIFLTFRSVTL